MRLFILGPQALITFTSSPYLTRTLSDGRLLSPKNPILPKLGASFPFEVAVGMNGRVWVKAADGEEEKIVALARELRGRQ